MATLQELDPKTATILATRVLAPRLDAEAKVDDEAQGNKGILMHKLIEAAKNWAQGEDSLSKVLGATLVVCISHLIKLPSKIHPKYADIAAQITTAMGRTLPVRAFVKNPDETFAERFGTTPAYKQAATRWVDMARWEINEFTKQEQKHQARVPGWTMEVKHYGDTYTSPVSMLQAGVAYTTVHQAFRNILRPPFIDLSELPDKVAEKHARAHVLKGTKGSIQIPLRGPGKDGQIVKTRTPVLGNAPLTHGAVLALLGGLSGPVTQRRYDELQAAMLLGKPEPKPAA